MSDAKLYRPGKKVKHFQYNSRFLACDPALEEFHPNYRWQVDQRYSDMDVSLDDAVRAIQRGYTSAIAAAQARVIPPLKMREDNWSWPVRASDIEEEADSAATIRSSAASRARDYNRGCSHNLSMAVAGKRNCG